ncbi:hypothetical protein O9H85_10115 [Paenibacillus filicis]|uniref:Fucose 4-O-acetylase n=1 Tax=Paenibacillus gyeongsangnamensis TaxID=3388067 RepID=A0ABT4Q7B6_9BACL|nr:hypothetical protein [Paenibacillus filicis]MCZ8512762.1 hypothetical protein [Paenibacillus filicis]
MNEHHPNDIFLLNTRFCLIVLVVLANALFPAYGASAGTKAVMLTIFSFHMPVFVLITGYFSRSFAEHPQPWTVIGRIALQYALFQTIYSASDYFFFHTEGNVYSFWAPYWMLWFLFSHACWKGLLLLFRTWKHPILAAVLLGLLAGYVPADGYWLSFSRTFVYFPFFLIGYYMQADRIRAAAARPALRQIAVAVLFMLLLSAWKGWLPIRIDWLLGSRTYSELHHSEWYAGLYRLGVYGLELAASGAFLLLMTERRSRMTDWGTRTVYVFLLHGLLLRVFAEAGLYRLTPTLPWTVGVACGAAALTMLLSREAVMRHTRFWIEPDPGALWKWVRMRKA